MENVLIARKIITLEHKDYVLWSTLFATAITQQLEHV